MSMALQGKSRHYIWSALQYRHWLSTAKACGFPEDEAQNILHRLLEKMDVVIEKVAGELPGGFPDAIAGPVFAGMRKTRDRLSRGARAYAA